MKSLPGGGPPRRLTLAEAEAMTTRDRRRIILLSVGALLLLGVYFTAQTMKPTEEDKSAGLPTNLAAQEESVYTMPFEDHQVLETILDATDDQRLALSGEALDSLLKYSVILGPRNYDALGARGLTSEVAAEFEATPSELRLDPLRVRGRLVWLGASSTQDVAVGERHLAAVELEEGGFAHLAFMRPTDLTIGEFVRLDGLFLQMYSGMADGELRGGPLVVGRQLRPSFATTEVLAHQDLVELLREEVRDDSVGEQQGEPHEALWQLMSFAALGADDIDWAAAPELDNEALALMSNDGTFFRGQPFRLAVCQNLATWTEVTGENSLRLDRISRGWIGNTTWKEPAPVVQFISPMDLGDLQDRKTNRLVTGKAFFLKNVHYTRSDGKSTALAPLFVVAELELFVPVPNRTPEFVLLAVLVGTILMIVMIFFLVRADSRSSRELQMEMMRRRRERRAREEQSEATPQGS